MKKTIPFILFLGLAACNNTPESKEPKADTSASSSADSILKAVEKMKADSASRQGDSSRTKDSLKK